MDERSEEHKLLCELIPLLCSGTKRVIYGTRTLCHSIVFGKWPGTQRRTVGIPFMRLGPFFQHLSSQAHHSDHSSPS
jgi:hypothetical protein